MEGVFTHLRDILQARKVCPTHKGVLTNQRGMSYTKGREFLQSRGYILQTRGEYPTHRGGSSYKPEDIS